MAHVYDLPLPDSESGTNSSILTTSATLSPPAYGICPTCRFMCTSLFATEQALVQHLANSGRQMLVNVNRETASFVNNEGTATHDPFGGRADMTLDLLSKLEGGNGYFIASALGPKVELDLELKL